MNILKHLSIKASISFLVIFTIIIFSAVVLIGFNQVSTQTSKSLGDNQQIIEALHEETEATMFDNLSQLTHQVDDSFSLFLNKMKEVLSTIENNQNLEVLDKHNALPSGPYKGTPYQILPPVNKYQVNEKLVPYFTHIQEGIPEIQFAYIGTPDGAMYIGPLGDYNFTENAERGN